MKAIEQEILENNQLIAEFHGWRVSEAKTTEGELVFRCDGNLIGYLQGVTHSSLDYHKSMDWLMPVIVKIENLNAIGETSEMKGAYKMNVDPWEVCFISYENEIEQTIVTIHRDSEDEDNLFHGVYDAVVEFIKWYNLQTKK